MRRQILVASTRMDCGVEMWEGSVRTIRSGGLARTGTSEEGDVKMRCLDEMLKGSKGKLRD